MEWTGEWDAATKESVRPSAETVAFVRTNVRAGRAARSGRTQRRACWARAGICPVTEARPATAASIAAFAASAISAAPFETVSTAAASALSAATPERSTRFVPSSITWSRRQPLRISAFETM